MGRRCLHAFNELNKTGQVSQTKRTRKSAVALSTHSASRPDVKFMGVCIPVAHADEEINFIPDVDVGGCFGKVEEQIAGSVHATDEPEGLLEGAHSSLLPLTANLGSATIGPDA